MVISKCKIPGAFESHPIKVADRIPSNPHSAVVYAHGSFDNMDGHYGFYANFLDEIASVGIASSQLSTSRDFDSYKRYLNTGNQYALLESFDGKIFVQEVEDVRKVLQRFEGIMDNQSLDDSSNNTLIGLSLGGTIMTLLSQETNRFNNLLLISSGCRTKSAGLGRVNSYEDNWTDAIKRSAAKFTGSVTHISPEHDNVVPKSYQDELARSFTSARDVQAIEIEGDTTDHVYTYHKDQLRAAMRQALGL